MTNVKVGTYVVMRVYKGINPSVIFTTSIYADAVSYANIMKRAEPDYDFAVADVKYTISSEQ